MAETLNYAGDFKLEKAEILTSTGVVINVLPFLLHVIFALDKLSAAKLPLTLKAHLLKHCYSY